MTVKSHQWQHSACSYHSLSWTLYDHIIYSQVIQHFNECQRPWRWNSQDWDATKLHIFVHAWRSWSYLFMSHEKAKNTKWSEEFEESTKDSASVLSQWFSIKSESLWLFHVASVRMGNYLNLNKASLSFSLWQQCKTIDVLQERPTPARHTQFFYDTLLAAHRVWVGFMPLEPFSSLSLSSSA